MHPLRLQYELFGPNNPFMSWVQAVAGQARESRKSVSFENPFLAMQEKMSQQIVDALDAWRQTVERASESAFHAIYGSPVLQTALGIDRNSDRQPRKSAKNQLHEAFVEAQIAALKAEIDKGGLPEGLARALLFVGKAREGADERGFEAIRRLRRAHPSARQLTFLQFKELLRKQFFMLLIDEEAAVAAIPKLLPKELDGRRAGLQCAARNTPGFRSCDRRCGRAPRSRRTDLRSWRRACVAGGKPSLAQAQSVLSRLSGDSECPRRSN